MARNLFVFSFLIVSICITGTSFSQQKKYTYQNYSASDVISAMTFNIRVDTFLDGFHRWSGRKDKVIDVLARNNADVFGVQEALVHQADDIQNGMPEYSHYFVGRDDGKQKGESCSIFYKKDRFKMDDCGTFWFSDTPEKPSKGWGAMWPRICSWIHLTDKFSGEGFYVYNVHLDVLSQNSRQKSAEMLTQRIAARKMRDPFIVLGDFNMKLNNPAMACLLGSDSQSPSVRMMDAWQAVHPDVTPATQIDHIPLGGGFTAVAATVDTTSPKGKFPSDHFPMIARISKFQPIAAETRLPRATRNN